jgi:hypothetical protein
MLHTFVARIKSLKQQRKGMSSAMPPTPLPTASVLSNGAKRRVEGHPYWLLLLLVIAVCVQPSRAQTIRILLVDGKTAKPIPGLYLTLFGGAHRLLIHRDAEGFTSDVVGAEVLQIGSIAHTATGNSEYTVCQDDKDYMFMPRVDSILNTGVMSKNVCSQKILAPKPGELIIFIRPLNWREKLTRIFFS